MINNRARLSHTDTSPARLALVFGGKAAEAINIGLDPYDAARLAFSFAERAQPVEIVTGLRGKLIGGINLHALAERMRRDDAAEAGR